MTAGVLFSRRQLPGWLALAPDLPTLGGRYPDLAARLLEHIDLARPAICLCAAAADLERAGRLAEELEVLLDRVCPVSLLGGSVGVPADAALVVLGGGSAGDWADALAESHPTGRLLETLESLILATGPAAAALGGWMPAAAGSGLCPAAAWLPEAIILPGVSAPGDEADVRERLAGTERLYALGLPPGAILALGPQGEVELWGSARPTVLLGGGWRQP